MDCPHLTHLTSSTRGNNSTNINNKPIISFSKSAQLICSVCGNGASPWICLECSVVHCGRYVNGHAKDHYESNTSHSIAVDCYSLTPYCYSCDQYLNPALLPTSLTHNLLHIHNNNNNNSDKTKKKPRRKGGSSGSSRKRRKRPNAKSTSKNTIQNSDNIEVNNTTEVCSSSSIASNNKKRKLETTGGGQVEVTSTTAESLAGGSIGKRGSKENSEVDSTEFGISDSNIPTSTTTTATNTVKHGVVGLRNLGNTCFMNAVLQSLSKIRGFSCYISNQIPPTTVLNSPNPNTHPNNTISRPTTPLPPQSQTPNDTNEGYSSVPESADLLPPPPRRLTRSSLNNINNNSTNLTNGQPTNTPLFVPDPYTTINTTIPIIDCVEAASVVELRRRREELLTNELRKILILLNTKGSSAVSPDSLFSIIWELMPKFRGYQQQDAHEFLRYMLDELHNELVRLVPKFTWNGSAVSGKRNNKNSKRIKSDLVAGDEYLINSSSKNTRSKDRTTTANLISAFGLNLDNGNYYNGSESSTAGSIVTSMFGGILENEVRCTGCGKESRKHDPFLDLSLDIPILGGNGVGGEARLVDCLASFTDVEELSDNDKYYCSHCQAHQKSTKRFSIRRLPNVLCLHLKRFRWSNYLRTKLDQYVSFPLRSLDMSHYLLRTGPSLSKTTRGSANSSLYDLAAVIVHHGTGVGSGHYTAFAKKDCQWYHFNDSAVKLSEEAAVAKCKAYILFYTRPQFKL